MTGSAPVPHGKRLHHGSGVILMSRSFMARTRDQSVVEILEEEDFFMSSCPAE
jgi:hypothetical protein